MNRSGAPILMLLTVLAGLLAVSLVILFDQIEHLSVFVLFLVMLLMVVVPVLVRLFSGEFDLFEPTLPYGAMNFLYYGAGALFVLFVQGVAQDSSVLPYIDIAAAYCALGYGCVLLGYWLMGRFVPARVANAGLRPGLVMVSIIYGIGFTGEITFAFIERAPSSLRPFVSGASSLVTGLSFFTVFSLFYVCFLVMSRQASSGFKSLLFAVMVPTQLLGAFLRFGNKTALFLMLGIPILAYWYARRKVAWKSLLVIVLVGVFIVFPLYYRVRSYRSPHYTQGYRIGRTLESMTSEKADVFAGGALRTTAKRLALINSTAIVIRDCGSRVEYEMGSTLWLGVIAVAIPRILWPGKPTINLGLEFGKKFHMTPFGNYSSVSPSQVGELYWNFNVPGIILGMFIIGAFLRILYLRFGANRGSDPVRLSIYVTVMYIFLQASGGYFGELESAVAKEMVILLVLEKLMVYRQGTAETQGVVAPEGAAALMAR